jgi:hypothetical protein
MIHVPWLPDMWGKRSPGLFDLVNVFPTIASLAGLPVSKQTTCITNKKLRIIFCFKREHIMCFWFLTR